MDNELTHSLVFFRGLVSFYTLTYDWLEMNETLGIKDLFSVLCQSLHVHAYLYAIIIHLGQVQNNFLAINLIQLYCNN